MDLHSSVFAKFKRNATGVCLAAALGGVADAASAADLSNLFKAPPTLPDLTWNGITVVGAVDAGVQYESHGTKYAGLNPSTTGLAYPSNTDPRWLLAPNQSTQSYVGLKIDRALTNDLNLIARLEVGFIPTTGDLANGLKASQLSNGIPVTSQITQGASPRAGQIFNGDAYAGFLSKEYGQIRFGRNSAVSTDMMAAYDPLFSYGFSLYGYVGYMAGGGSVETVKIDQSVKYLHQIGMFRTELEYGAPGTNVNQFMQGSVGIVRPEFSVDVFGGKSKDSVTISALSGAANLGSPFLGARVNDTSMYGIFGKYAFDIGGRGFNDPNSSKFIVSGGYNNLRFTNPSDGGFAPGHVDIGGFLFGPVFSTNGSSGTGIVNYAYQGKDRVVQSFFIAGKYQHDEHWSVAATYNIFAGNSYGFGVNSIPGVTAPVYSNVSCSTNQFTNCSGNEQVVAMRVDYDWTKNLRLYGGVTFSKVYRGFAFGYLHPDEIAPTVGMRYAF